MIASSWVYGALYVEGVGRCAERINYRGFLLHHLAMMPSFSPAYLLGRRTRIKHPGKLCVPKEVVRSCLVG